MESSNREIMINQIAVENDCSFINLDLGFSIKIDVTLFISISKLTKYIDSSRIVLENCTVQWRNISINKQNFRKFGASWQSLIFIFDH